MSEKEDAVWRERIIETKEKKGISTKTIAEKSDLPEETVSRILKGKTHDPRLETVIRVGAAVGLTAGEIFDDTGIRITDEGQTELKARLDRALSELEALRRELEALTHENEHLKAALAHKDEIIAIHNEYKAILTSLNKQ